MPRRRLMTEKYGVVQRLRAGEPLRSIRRETGLHRSTIRVIAAVAREHGWIDEQRPIPEVEEVSKVLSDLCRDRLRESHPLDEYREMIGEWLEDKYTYVAIHELVQELFPCSEATVRRYIQRTFPKPAKTIVHRDTIPGAIMEVDFSSIGLTYDRRERRNRKTYVFSGRLRHSRKAHRERVYDQKQETFFACHIHAFEYFGGVPETVVPDNLKAAVVAASFEDPIVNRAYLDLALHYRFLISPCLPQMPQHKGGVENDIGYIKRRFLAVFRARQRQLGRTVPDGEELATELLKWSTEVADERTVKGIGIVPREVFDSEEQAALKPLPAFRWDPLTVATAKVQEGWRVQFDRAYYSVPYRYIGRQVKILANHRLVRIFCEDNQIASHSRANNLWQIIRDPAHAPPAAVDMLATTREGLLHRAAAIGEPVERVASAMFSRGGVDGLRPCRALLSFQSKCGTQRLLAACVRALAYERPEYRLSEEHPPTATRRADRLQASHGTPQRRRAELSIRATTRVLQRSDHGGYPWMKWLN